MYKDQSIYITQPLYKEINLLNNKKSQTKSDQLATLSKLLRLVLEGTGDSDCL